MKIRISRLRAKDTFSACILLMGLVLLSPRPALAAKILFVVDDFPPYQYLTPGGKARGLSYEVVLAVFDSLRIPIQVNFLPWKRAILTTKKGDASGVFPCGYKKKTGKLCPLFCPHQLRNQRDHRQKNLPWLSDFNVQGFE